MHMSIKSGVWIDWIDWISNMWCCSRERFGEMHARLWWEENRARIHEQYLWNPSKKVADVVQFSSFLLLNIGWHSLYVYWFRCVLNLISGTKGNQDDIDTLPIIRGSLILSILSYTTLCAISSIVLLCIFLFLPLFTFWVESRYWKFWMEIGDLGIVKC